MFNKEKFKILVISLSFVLLFSFSTIQSENVLNEDEFFSYESDNLIIRYFNLQIDNIEEERKDSDTPVKSGDSILITTPEGKNILIDSGINYVGDKLYKYLDKIGVRKIDYAFATHPHWDHIGGYLNIFNNIDIGKLYYSDTLNDSSTYIEYLELIKSNEIDNEYLEIGDLLNIESNIKIEILSAPEKTNLKNSSSEEENSTRQINNQSLVMNFSYGDTSFLITGDIYKEKEKELAEKYTDGQLEADILHAPHHGEETSSSFELIEAVKPDYTIISRSELGSIPIFNRYRSYDIEVYVTGLNGHILIESDGNDIKVFTEKVIDSPYLN